MDKLVERVTVIQGSGQKREVKVVYDQRHEEPSFPVDEIVSRVTVVQGSGQNRHAVTVYENKDWGEEGQTLDAIERGVRRVLKADMIRAREAYENHIKSVSEGGRGAWLLDAPGNIARAFIKAEKTIRKGYYQEAKKGFRKQRVEGDRT
jgi:hypothetical protein